ncbi:hypothetical protein EZV62_010168 [Acer yangbiense]|uniref:Coenzyme Q-binding protein COQ10 START domain-containing protein n=1 Tax=Acer yangbiense TaxID=1000413 RepID=A0A5C7I239_9ROSI|nr:hypothetical protein EZV62_010168 [Acer yangbiense]
MRAYPLSLHASSYLLVFQTSTATPQHYSTCRFPFTSTSSNKNTSLSSLFTLSQTHSTPTPANCSNSDFPNLDSNDDDDDFGYDGLLELKSESLTGDGVYIEIEKFGRNSRRIQSKIEIEANLDTVWNILTDYERLVDFIPGLAVSELVEKKDNFARLYQIGLQNLPFGLKFNAKGVLDCYEKDLEIFPHSKKRDIEFKMIEGDFQLFEGKWSLEQVRYIAYSSIRILVIANGFKLYPVVQFGKFQDTDSTLAQGSQTTLSYVVNVQPKMWLPVRLVEGRLSKEIKTNLSCIREAARKIINKALHTR